MPELEIRTCSEADAAAVAQFVCSHPHGQIGHTWPGVQLLAAASDGRWQPNLALACRGGRIAGVMPWALLRVGRLPLRMCRSVGGILAGEDSRREVIAALLEWLVDRSRQERCCRIEANFPFAEYINEQPASEAAEILEVIDGHAFRRLPPPHWGTYWLSLGEDEQMLAALSSKCRRDVRKGLREGAEVSLRTDASACDEFQHWYFEMCRRKSLPARSPSYFRNGIIPCVRAGLAAFFACTCRGQICNMALVSLTGQPAYLLGATAPAALEKGMPPTGQPLHFGIMRHLRDLGRATYDLGGSPGPVPQRGHHNYGVWAFKQEFGGPYVTYIDSVDRTLSKLPDMILRGARKTLDWVRRRNES